MKEEQGKSDEPEVVFLDDCYAQAVLGHTVSVAGMPRMVYSLPLLVGEEMKAGLMAKEDAERSVAAMVGLVSSEHGDLAPVFVDDSIRRSLAKPRIIRPGGWSGRKGA